MPAEPRATPANGRSVVDRLITLRRQNLINSSPTRPHRTARRRTGFHSHLGKRRIRRAQGSGTVMAQTTVLSGAEVPLPEASSCLAPYAIRESLVIATRRRAPSAETA
ncbi:hypothetical protein GCM10022416_25930 [Actinomadura keratinilytica]|uniref:Uncharacterized protein n=1 Tax=Actinomadura keratinilytica TaxID=547461 RepID=A0ABP7YQY3_9ACTN